MKKKVLIFGATGMLGSAIYDVLKDKYALVLTVRDRQKVDLLERVYGGTNQHEIVEFDANELHRDFSDGKGFPSKYLNKFLKEAGKVDYAINAIGVITPFATKDVASTFFINSALPHILAREFGEKLIHVTTDCVFNGQEGFLYDENSPKTPNDIYDLSKSLGEPTGCLIIRTSIIGRELESFTSLLEWFLQQEGKEINGFTEHFWNGITAQEFGKICDKIISNPEDYPETGLYHIFSDTLSKYEMLVKFKKKFGVECKINKSEKSKVNRELVTIHDFNKKLDIPSFDEMLEDL